MKYFVLKPGGADDFAEASRHAMKRYANHIELCGHGTFAGQIREWVEREEAALKPEAGE